MNTTPIHPSKTGLDSRFEDELASILPDWRSDPEMPHKSELAKTKPVHQIPEDRKIEENMILGS
jgi:hypothetical protein